MHNGRKHRTGLVWEEYSVSAALCLVAGLCVLNQALYDLIAVK